MRYEKRHVAQALSAAQQAGIDTAGMKNGDRDTELTLERMGFLPVDPEAADALVADWYVRNGLARREGSPSTFTVNPSEATGAAVAAAEAALEAAAAALRLVRALGGEAA